MEKVDVYKLVRSRRKTLCLQIKENGNLIVRAPLFLSKKSIVKFLKEKKSWIQKNKKKITNSFKLKPKKFINGESFLYLGKKYKLEIKEGAKTPLVLERASFIISEKNPKKAKEIFKAWYKEKAKTKITERVKIYSRITGLKFNSIKITSAKKRLGSCSYKNDLNFTWRLILAPLEILDSVVVHELAHIKEKNHSKKFWKKVEEINPEYSLHKKWLKENGYLLSF